LRFFLATAEGEGQVEAPSGENLPWKTASPHFVDTAGHAEGRKGKLSHRRGKRARFDARRPKRVSKTTFQSEGGSDLEWENHKGTDCVHTEEEAFTVRGKLHPERLLQQGRRYGRRSQGALYGEEPTTSERYCPRTQGGRLGNALFKEDACRRGGD